MPSIEVAPLDWVVHVDFYEMPDYQVRVESRTQAVAMVSRWISEGCVSKTEWLVGADPEDECSRVERVFPIGTVKQFDIRCVPAGRAVAGPLISVSGRLPLTP